MDTLAQLDQKIAEIAELEEMLEEAVETLERKTEQLEVQAIKLSHMESSMQGLEASQKMRNQEIEAVRFDAAQEKSRLQQQLGSLRNTNDELRKELESLRGRTKGSSNQEIEAIKYNAAQEKLQLQEQLKSLKIANEALLKENENLQMDLLANELVQHSPSSGNLSQCGDLQDQLDETRNKLAQQLQELESVSNEKMQLQYQMDYFQTTYGPRMLALEAAKVVTDKGSERLKKRLEDLEKNNADLQKEVAVLRGQLLATKEFATRSSNISLNRRIANF